MFRTKAGFVGEDFFAPVGGEALVANSHEVLARFVVAADALRIADEVVAVGAEHLGRVRVAVLWLS